MQRLDEVMSRLQAKKVASMKEVAKAKRMALKRQKTPIKPSMRGRWKL
jgi:hypothetical protein